MIKSILDSDLYKFTMQQAVLQLYPDAVVTFEFTSRKNTKFTQEFCVALQNEINNMGNLRLTHEEFEYLNTLKFISPSYAAYLRDYKFDPSEVKIVYNSENQTFKLTITGLWHRTILWEVPLLALISETYFKVCDTNWNNEGQEEKILLKGKLLSETNCIYADFGTRRRRNFESQERVVKTLKDNIGFVGTSNVYLAMENNIKPIGTMAHEFIMGVSALESLRYANRFALYNWNKVYNGNLGIALTDTFGTEAFFEDFDGVLARLFDGVRHDSGDPFEFANKVVNHYEKINVNHKTKTIVFSDGLNPEVAISIKKHCDEIGILCSFGIGTNFTNDYDNSPALNIVIKLRSVKKNINSQEIQVVKISDVPTKATGDVDALRVAQWTFFGNLLDEVEQDSLVPSLHGWHHADAENQPIPFEKLGDAAKKLHKKL